MSLHVSAVPSSVKNNAKEETKRRSADYHPSIWGHHFLSYATDSMESDDDNAKLLKLKEEIKSMLMDDANKSLQKLDLVNVIQRLGVSYHFESEVNEILEDVYKAHNESDSGDDTDDLYSISLKFRLLRQHGYKISCACLNSTSSRYYMSIYHEEASHNEVILTFAKLDFNILQKLHQKELSAITKWNISAIDQLPDYMKLCYKALLDIYSEIEPKMADQGKLYRLDFAKEAMKSIVRNYHTEAKWCHEKYFPTLDEYMSVALVTSAYQLLTTTSFVGMGDVATKEAFEWLFSYPKVLKAASIICRLMDDIVGHKHEQKRGHVASAIECYMKDHGVSEEETLKVFREQIANAWKDINEAFLKPTAFPLPLLERILNFTRVIDLLYKDDDCYTNSYLTKDHVASLLRDPVQL
ncbi:hypothetical protein Patl1_04439 [Pistacia atlantica]|uniref:Uncharacterized protein n=1 Tax=Pistacia atlantica TaxID=434234 RepID=A0ACC1BTZ3_9ROSI|nr:hypothetical protein Patl1_04439 [Pistacia atlantica]